ncbi:hypothetical protein L2E82_39277 [Cichorium intybus]|uniref:Uncharacterized protein n=1 Tax=Cichorium intybus TaxID=13427 RepID=A0ACB9AIQ3_CICIN|nr:hypothetical protein L2E82_39277 [Cichorium intybus]
MVLLLLIVMLFFLVLNVFAASSTNLQPPNKRGSEVNRSWKNSEEEEFMWDDVNSHVPVSGKSGGGGGSKRDPRSYPEPEKSNPGNELYCKSFEVAIKSDLHKQVLSQQAMRSGSRGGPSTSSSVGVSRKSITFGEAAAPLGVYVSLQAFTEVPNLNLWYGPDSYMDANIVELFHQMTLMAYEEISKIHPDHTRNSINDLLLRLHYFQDGTCIVHHLFGHQVVEKIIDMYCDAFLTAHFEVPGEMFYLAMEAKRRRMRVETTRPD